MSTIKKLSGRKTQIENHATRLFQNRGFAATSMRDLATELQIEAASLYSHIRSKNELLKTICFTMAEAFFEALEAVPMDSMRPQAQLKGAIQAHVRVITENTAAAAVFFSEWRHLTEPFLTEFLAMRSDYENKFLAIIKKGVESEAFIINDPKFTVRMLFNSMNWIHTWYKPEGAMKAAEISEKIFDTLFNGIGRHERSDSITSI